MLKWEIKNGDEKLKENIKGTKENFDYWYNGYWSKTCSIERMLSEKSPVEHVYYKMCKSFEEVKEKYPLEATEKCSSCEKQVDIWIETSFSFCDEYDCGMILCKDCAEKLKTKIEQLLNNKGDI